MEKIPCVTDSDEWRFDSEPDEPDSPLTLVEQRLFWICEEWVAASGDNTYESWNDLRMMLHGASMALNQCVGRHDDRMAIADIQRVVLERSLMCIEEGKYEGA